MSTRIGEVAVVQSGAGFPEKHQGHTDRPIPFYKVSDMNILGNEHEMIYANNSISEDVRLQLGAKIFPKGSTVFPKIGGAIATNKKRLASMNCCVDNNVMGVIPKVDKIHSEFLFYFFQSFNLSDLANDAHLPSIKSSVVSDWEIRLPHSLSEQQRIVAILDDALDGIATAKVNAEMNLRNARAIFLSQRELLLSPQHGWGQAALADLCDVKHGYAFEGEFFAQDGDYVLLTPGSFFETGGYRERGEKTKYFVGPIPNNYILGKGDLLVAMTEQAAGLLGSPLLVPEPNRFLHNQRLGLVTGKPGVPWLNEFFFHVFNLERVRQEIHASASGVKVRHTSPGRIGEVRVSFPISLVEQRRITNVLSDLSEYCARLEAIYQQKLTALDELKKSLLHRAFSGDL